MNVTVTVAVWPSVVSEGVGDRLVPRDRSVDRGRNRDGRDARFGAIENDGVFRERVAAHDDRVVLQVGAELPGQVGSCPVEGTGAALLVLVVDNADVGGWTG